MRNFHTVVLERMKYFSHDFETEPYEAGWAKEAIFALRVHQISGSKVAMDSRVQISVDGIEWMDEETHFPTIRDSGNYFVKVSHFGGWLRLACEIKGENPNIRLTAHLVLKE